ncbi:MAG: SGNH/GDSL hydrolase family protein [Verrucomicrobiaceae bacterium]
MISQVLRALALSLLLLPLSSAGEKPALADPSAYLGPIVTELEKKWPANRTVNIVCHGHSVPAGYFKTPHVDTFNAYPHLLHLKLKERFPHAVINVINTSIGGENSLSGAKRFDKEVLPLRPDIITIDYALNDRPVGLEKSKAAWQSMITKAQARGAKVILLTPTGDTRSKLNDPAAPLNQHAEQVRQLARQNNVALTDSLTLFKNHLSNGGQLTDLMSQVNHPNRKGHDLVVTGLLKWFPNTVTPTTVPRP